MRCSAFKAIAALPVLVAAGASAWAADTTVTGTFVAGANITVTSTIPSGGQVWCHVRVSSSNALLYEEANVQATLASGVYSCAFHMPFFWDLGSSASTTATAVWETSILNTALSNTALTTSGLAFPRASGHPIFTTLTVKAGTNTFPTLTIHM